MKPPQRYTHKKANTWSSLLVLFVLAWCSAGFVVWNLARTISYQYVRSYRDVLEFRDTLVVPAQELKGSASLVWMKHDEIRYQGHMFDIKHSLTLVNGQVMLVGHFDKFENKLFKALENLLGTRQQGTPAKHKQVVFWHCDAVMPAPFLLPHSYIGPFIGKPLPEDWLVIIFYRPEVPSPPPDVC